MDFKLNYVTTKLELGAEKPFKFLHISDNHTSLADEREEEKKLELAQNRELCFKNANKILFEARDFIKENDTFMVHTGDLIDFISEKNYEYATEYASSCHLFLAAGNHEFANYLGEREDKGYKNR